MLCLFSFSLCVCLVFQRKLSKIHGKTSLCLQAVQYRKNHSSTKRENVSSCDFVWFDWLIWLWAFLFDVVAVFYCVCCAGYGASPLVCVACSLFVLVSWCRWLISMSWMVIFNWWLKSCLILLSPYGFLSNHPFHVLLCTCGCARAERAKFSEGLALLESL